MLVNLDHTPPKYNDVLKFMEVLGKYQVGGRKAIGLKDYLWLKLKAFDSSFMNWVNFAGGWAHGTHCAGIASVDSENIKIKGITHIPAGEKPKAKFYDMIRNFRATPATRNEQSDPMAELNAWFDQMATEAIEEIQAEAEYIGSLNPRVINCSFGSENQHLLMLFKQVMVEELGISNPSWVEVQELVNLFVTRVFLPRDKEFFKNVPNALIVIAAGNSSENNENIVVSPNNVPLQNKLVVAATHEDKALAPFSCYGRTKVDVAVPGVNIYATYPNNKMGYMSGTSMAAPLASRYAAMVVSSNPQLSAVDVKQILMGTVDKKPWLFDKVRSGGVINPDRAVYAAELTKQGVELGQAIAQSRREVEDKLPATRQAAPLPMFETQEEIDIYFSAIF